VPTQKKNDYLLLLPTISIIVLNYNGKKYLNDCFFSLAKINYPTEKLEVILVDNGSSDGSVDYVKLNYPWVKIVPLSRNYGFTGGNNRGVRFATGDYIVFLNNDVVVDTNWLIELTQVVMDNPTAILTSKSLFFEMPDIIDHDGTKATFIGRSFQINFNRKNDTSKSTPKYVVQPYGASMMVKKSVFEDLGEFDEVYFTSLEDTDLGLKAWLYGYKVIYVPTSFFYHVGGGTGGWGNKISNTLVFHLTKNSYMNVIKYFSSYRILQGITFSLLYYLVSVIGSIREGRIDSIKAILHAHFWVIKNSGLIISKRYDLKKRQCVASSFLFRSSFFATLPEMIKENSVIQKFYMTYYGKRK
jgi:GT2 family glycosyltransferase